MANYNPKPPPARWKKGQSGNPRGTSAKVRELGKIRTMTSREVSAIGTMILQGDMTGLLEIAKEQKGSVLQAWMATLIIKSMNKGDAQPFRALLDRIVGRPKEFREISGPDGGAIPVRTSTTTEKLSRIEQLRKSREEMAEVMQQIDAASDDGEPGDG